MDNIYHNHHIIPKHMGGTDAPDNYVKLTVSEHAAAHKELWEQHGKRQDWIAWQFLSKQITLAEAIKMAQRLPKTKEWKEKISKIAKERNHIQTLREALKNPEIKKKHAENTSKGLKGVSKSESHKLSMSKRTQNTTKVECPHCSKTGQYTNMKRWHFDRCKLIP